MAHNKITLNGYLGTGVERWSVGLNYASVTDDPVTSPSDLSAWATAVLALFGAAGSWQTSVKDGWGTSGGLDQVRAYYHPTSAGPAAAAGVSSGATQAGTGTVTLPPQVSMVCSLHTAQAGRSYRGRFYWPSVAGGVTTTLRRGGTPSIGTLATAFSGMLNAIGAAAVGSVGQKIVVVSPSKDLITPVIQVSVGDVYDTQRRRRDALVENRAYATI